MESTYGSTGAESPDERDTITSPDGTRISCTTVGSGRPVVFVHGSLSTGDGWRRVADLLSDGHRVTTFDRRGHGASVESQPYSFDREVEDIQAVLASVGPDAVLVGHSFGGAAAFAAARGLELGALVLYEPGLAFAGPIGGEAVDEMERALDSGDPESAMLTGMTRVVGLSETEAEAARESPAWSEQIALLPTWPRELRGLDALDVTPAAFADIRVPTLLLRGSESPIWLRDTAERAAGYIPGAAIVDLSGQGHGAGDTAPELVAETIRDFLDGIDGSETPSSPRTVISFRSDTSWNGTPYDRYPEERPRLTVVRYSIPPHSSLPWHRHDIPNTAFVISGSITLQSMSGAEHVFRAGDAFAESVGDEHRGFTGDEAAEIVCTYAGADGIPLSRPTGR